MLMGIVKIVNKRLVKLVDEVLQSTRMTPRLLHRLNLLPATLDGGFQQQLLAHFQIGYKQTLCYCASGILRLLLYERP